MFDMLVLGRVWMCALFFERVLHDKICVRLGVNIVLSMYGFMGVASFEIVKFGIRKIDFSCVFTC